MRHPSTSQGRIHPSSRSPRGGRAVFVGLMLVAGVWGLELGSPTWAGEYFTEEVTSPSLELLHGWRGTIGDLPISVTNSSRGTIRVPLEVKSSNCTAIDLVLSSGRTITLSPIEQCSVNLFPQLDKLINRDVTTLRVSINGQPREIPLSDQDRISLAKVANQSRDAFLLFQQEMVRALEQFRRPTAAPVAVAPPAPIPLPTPLLTPTPQTPISTPVPATVLPPNPAGSADLVIVGQIKEERLGAGSKLSVQAINRSTRMLLSAQAKFDFFKGNQLVDSRTTAFSPVDVPPGQQASAQVVKTEDTWDRVTVSFLWQKP